MDSSSDEDDDEEFFDAVDAGEVELVMEMPKSPPPEPEKQEQLLDFREQKKRLIEPSYIGYEDGPRKKLAMDADDRPKISLWVSVAIYMMIRFVTRLTCARCRES